MVVIRPRPQVTAGPGMLLIAAEALAAVDRDPASGLPLAESAAQQASRAAEAGPASIAERAWGHALLHVGELDDAIRHFSRSVVWGTRAGSPELVAEARQKRAFAILQRGRPRAALREINYAIMDLRGTAAARARAQRAIILHVIGRLDDALAEFDTALPVMRRNEDLLGVQRMLINRALVHSDRHAFAAARRDLLEAEGLARQLGRTLTIGLIANNLGLMEKLRGDVPAALRYLDRAERIIGEHGAQLGTLYQDRAELLLSVGLITEARAAADAAVQAYRAEGRSLKVPEVYVLQSQIELLAGDLEAARHHARAAMRRFRSQHRPEWLELARLAVLRAGRAAGSPSRPSRATLDSMVTTLSGAGWPAAALDANIAAAQALWSSPAKSGLRGADDYLIQAASARQRGPALTRARGWYAVALQRLRAGDEPAVLRAARAGLSVLTEHSDAMGATDLRVHAATHRADLAGVGLRVALGSGQPQRVLEWAERSRASQVLPRPVQPPADPELGHLLADLRRVVQDRADDASDGTGRPSARTPELVARQATLERRIRDRSRHLDGTGSPAGRAQQARAGVVRMRDLSERLGPWALAEFVQAGPDIHVVTVAGRRSRIHRLGGYHEVADLAERVAFAMRRWARAASRPGPAEAAAALLRVATRRLDTLLLQPLGELGDRPLVVVPTGVLHGLPWSLLPSCAGRPVTIAPSATLWHQAAARLPSPGPFTAAAGPRLPAAAQEAEAVAQIHGGTALTGSAASVEAVQHGLATSRAVHLAAHGRLSAGNPLLSDVMLADGPLMIYDLERLPQVPHTVVLAACDGGRAVVRTGNELLGLAVAFLSRGTAQLVAPVVPVPDAPTAPLMIAFHQRLAQGCAAAQALAEAQLELSGQDAETAATAAGFICLGAGSSPLA